MLRAMDEAVAVDMWDEFCMAVGPYLDADQPPIVREVSP